MSDLDAEGSGTSGLFTRILLATAVLAAAKLLLNPGLLAALCLTAGVWLLLLRATREWLRFADYFPGLLNLPLGVWLFGTNVRPHRPLDQST